MYKRTYAHNQQKHVSPMAPKSGLRKVSRVWVFPYTTREMRVWRKSWCFLKYVLGVCAFDTDMLKLCNSRSKWAGRPDAGGDLHPLGVINTVRTPTAKSCLGKDQREENKKYKQNILLRSRHPSERPFC